MSESQNNTVSLNILGKLYKVKCPQDKIIELREAAQYLETKMREMSHASKQPSMDRLAVITALNIAYDFLCQKKQVNAYTDVINQQLKALQNKIETAVEKVQEKEL